MSELGIALGLFVSGSSSDSPGCLPVVYGEICFVFGTGGTLPPMQICNNRKFLAGRGPKSGFLEGGLPWGTRLLLVPPCDFPGAFLFSAHSAPGIVRAAEHRVKNKTP